MNVTIAAIATGNSAAGIGIIRISGDEAISIAQKVFVAMDSTPLEEMKGYTAKYGKVYSNGESFDNAVALVFRAPHSYTGEDVVEISVHGGKYILQKTLQAVLDAGARSARPGEFTKRAYMNGKLDLAQAEAIASLISAQGKIAAETSYNMLRGSLGGEIEKVVQMLVDFSSLISAWVDYPDEEIPELEHEKFIEELEKIRDYLGKMLDNYENGLILTQGVNTTIVGKTNVGKSTLMNMMCGQNKSIVTDIEGTTRDVVEGTVRFGDLVLHLADTAGFRQNCDPIEVMGMDMALDKIALSRLIIAVFDASRPLNGYDETVIKCCRGKASVAVINKIDLPSVIDEEKIKEKIDNIVYLSAYNQTGAEELEKAIIKAIGVDDFDYNMPLIITERQRECVKYAKIDVEDAIKGLNYGVSYDAVNVTIEYAIDELLSITGKRATKEVVDSIFRNFCVGK